MPILGETQFLERIQFFNGQRLFASDLQTLEAFNREMRWLHNQSLHQPGVGSGYAVHGDVGDREVTIAPGYALDSLGREIILTETFRLAVPPVADNGSGGSVFYLLTVSYPDDSDLKTSETRNGICVQQGVVRLREDPVFCWVRLNDNDTNRQPVDANLKLRITKGFFIVLGQIEVFNCKLKQPISSAQRRNAVPPKQPRIACGIQPVKWTLILGEAGVFPDLSTIGSVVYKTEINTSAAGFQATPFYVARLMGPRTFEASDDGISLIFADALLNVVTGFTPTGFTVHIFPFSLVITDGPSMDISQILDQWQIAWMGVES
jgi:hypothetical protein